MAARDAPPYRADHVGSLLRPPQLIRARQAFDTGGITAQELAAVEDDAIRTAVAMQEEVGLRVATDGEFRRAHWLADFMLGLDGVERHDRERTKNARAYDVVGRIGLSQTVFADAFTFLATAVTDASPKLTIPSPAMLHYRSGRDGISRDVYPDLDEFWSDLEAAYRDQIERLHALGCRYLQLDDTSLAYMNDPDERARVRELGGDPDRQHVDYIAHINRALAGRPAGMAITTHLCRGNFKGAFFAAGGYEFVAEALFGELDVDGFFLEYDDERSGGFEPLRFVPPGKQVVLGLVTTKRGELEEADELKRRIEAATAYLDHEQLCLSPQCGFASVLEGNPLSHEEQRRKLELIVSVAEEVWGR